MTERWLHVVGYEGIYEVSDLGRVRSIPRTTPDGRRIPGRILRARKMHDGYMRVCLCRENVKSDKHVHILVCRSFLGEKPTPDHVVAHGDGTRDNNALGNLRWATRHENELDKLIHGTKLLGERTNCAKLTEPEVYQIRAMPGSHASVAARFGVSPFAIYAIRRRRNWGHLPEKPRSDEAAIPTG